MRCESHRLPVMGSTNSALPRARRSHPHLADGEGQPPRAAVYERLGAVREEWLDYSLAV